MFVWLLVDRTGVSVWLLVGRTGVFVWLLVDRCVCLAAC